ncbi:hypothetical protein MTJW_09580 [Moorella thermoacetica]|nr:hypothetical protein MTJW_09580 [Moorella thermoacetica]
MFAMLAKGPTVLNPMAILLAMGFYALVGSFFGYYPAR